MDEQNYDMVEEGRLLIEETSKKVSLLQRLIEKRTISEGLGEYGKVLVTIDFSIWEAKAHARLRNIKKAAESLADTKCFLDRLYFLSLYTNQSPDLLNPLPKQHYRELIWVAERRYKNTISEVEIILEGRLN